MGSDTGGSAKIHLCRYLHKCGIEGGERVRLARKQIMADLSRDDSTSVGTPVPKGAARRDPRRGEIPVMCGQALFPFLPWTVFSRPCLGKLCQEYRQAFVIIKFLLGPPCCVNDTAGRFSHLGENNECKCVLLQCRLAASPAGASRVLHEEGSGKNINSDCQTDWRRYKLANFLTVSLSISVNGLAEESMIMLACKSGGDDIGGSRQSGEKAHIYSRNAAGGRAFPAGCSLLPC